MELTICTEVGQDKSIHIDCIPQDELNPLVSKIMEIVHKDTSKPVSPAPVPNPILFRTGSDGQLERMVDEMMIMDTQIRKLTDFYMEHRDSAKASPLMFGSNGTSHTIACIKIIRELTNWCLTDAKRFIDARREYVVSQYFSNNVEL